MARVANALAIPAARQADLNAPDGDSTKTKALVKFHEQKN